VSHGAVAGLRSRVDGVREVVGPPLVGAPFLAHVVESAWRVRENVVGGGVALDRIPVVGWRMSRVLRVVLADR
jgi:hypothetical protein